MLTTIARCRKNITNQKLGVLRDFLLHVVNCNISVEEDINKLADVIFIDQGASDVNNILFISQGSVIYWVTTSAFVN